MPTTKDLARMAGDPVYPGRGGATAAKAGDPNDVYAALQHNRAIEQHHGLDAVETRVVSAEEPGLEPGAFDRVLIAEVDHLLPDRVVYLRKLRRALKPGGFIAVENRLPYQAALLSAAAAADLAATEVPLDLPAHFFARLEPK